MNGSKKTQTTSMTLPSFLHGPMQNAIAQSTDYFDRAKPFEGQTYVDFSDQTMQGLDSIENMAGAGGPAGLQSALNNYQGLMSGDFLHGGSGFNAAFDAASDRILPSVAAQFNRSGRMHGELGAGEATRQLGHAFAGLYDAERGRQMQGLSMAPQMTQLAYDPAQRMLGVGAMHEAKAGEELQDEMYRDNFRESNLDRYLSRLSGVAPFYGQQTSTQSGGGGSLFGKILGAGLSLGGMALGGPMGGAIGGQLGGLLGGGGTPSPFMSGMSLGGGGGPSPFMIANRPFG